MELASRKATSGAVPPAICVVSLVDALSADTFSNWTVMFGCSLWKSLANFFICGESPTHDSNVSVTGLVGSDGTIGWMVDPDGTGSALLLGAVLPLLTHAVATMATTAAAAATLAPRHVILRMLTWLPPVLGAREPQASPGRASPEPSPARPPHWQCEQTDLLERGRGSYPGLGFVKRQPSLA